MHLYFETTLTGFNNKPQNTMAKFEIQDREHKEEENKLKYFLDQVL